MYRATEFKRVDWESLRDEVGTEGRIVFAVDVAKEDFFAGVMKADRRLAVTVKWRHPEQTREVVERMAGLGASRVEAVLEPSGTYGDSLCGLLRSVGIGIHRVSPKRVHDAAELYDGVPSLHDAKAAYVIGRLHLEGVSQPWREASVQRRELQAQLKLLGQYRERHQRALNRLEALLARHWPEAPAHLDLASVSLLHLLERYGDPAAMARDATAARTLLRQIGGHWLKPEKVEALLASARTTLGVPCVDGERRLVQALAQEMLETQRQSAELEKRLATQVQADAALGRQAAAIGRVSAVVLHCALGSVCDYTDARSYLKAAGLNLKERSSGKHKGQLKITKRGPGVVRVYLYFAVLRLIAREGPARRWYLAKAARDGGRKGKAITALMRKLTKALWHVGRGAAFDEAKLFGGQPQERAA
jgi:transposase